MGVYTCLRNVSAGCDVMTWFGVVDNVLEVVGG